jgi:hypothetical protein
MWCSVNTDRRFSHLPIGTLFSAVVIAAAYAVGPVIWHEGRAAEQRINATNHSVVVQLAAQWKVFSDPKIGIEFSYPNNRKVVVGCHYQTNCVALIGRTTWPDDYLVAFAVFDGTLETVAVDQAVFQKEGDHWVAKGRNGTHRVEQISGPGWRGLKSVVDCGISDSTGFHAGAGKCLWVVVTDGKRSIVADTQGTAPIDQDTMRSIQSLRFSSQLGGTWFEKKQISPGLRRRIAVLEPLSLVAKN